MDSYEEAVMGCLVANGETFVVPQMDIGGGWCRPDFVAIRPPKRQVYVVEVTTSGMPRGLVEKVNDRDHQWLLQLRAHLEGRRICDQDWIYSVLVFVRRDQEGWFREQISDCAGVTVLCVEDAFAHWEWNEKVWTGDFSFETDKLRRDSAKVEAGG